MWKLYENYQRRAINYFSKYPNYNALVHLVAGMGLGFILTYPLAGTHPVRWGVAFVALSVVGHWWAGRK
ncbi:hypothetical protein HYV22_01420 [Candidatus Gottesmanbacteria bacterium]|nr:hypothetical protein [Candidatus Gottesmanbacteria bacterium]